ncbi:MAG: NAD(P)-dependent oxidoreductase [Halobacteria archaeon]|nr:NAD(P)-dependent oxidoreductase [Halobacteria archaeon]
MKVGFIGLGSMGAPMAWNVRDAGYGLCVYNRTRDKTKPFAEEGVEVAKTPAELSETSDVVVTMVTDGDALIDVLRSDEGALAPEVEPTVFVNMSTISHDATIEAASLIEDEGAEFVDSPVSGTVGPAEEGTLTVLASGDEDTVDEYRPLLSAMGDPVVYCGDIGQGTNMKLTINLLLGDMMQAFSEALVFGEKKGLDTDDVFEVIESSPLSSTLYDIKGDMIRQDDFEPRFSVDLLFKDLSLALEAAGDDGLPLPATAASREALNAVRGLGHGDEDMAAAVKGLEETAGVRVRDDDD